MSTDHSDAVASSIIIVRRKKVEEGGHGSTAWKIAFADFMTAMMALFLVLWLINSTDEATKKQIATYFNPLKLNEETARPKGVLAESSEVATEGEKEKLKPAEGESSGTRRERVGSLTNGPMTVEERLFRDPYDLIRRLSAQSKQDGAGLSGLTAAGVDGGPAVKAGEAYRDPFDPVFRSEMLEQSRSAKAVILEAEVTSSGGADAADRADSVAAAEEAVEKSEKRPDVAADAPLEDPTEGKSEAGAMAVSKDLPRSVTDADIDRTAALKGEARRISDDVAEAIADLEAASVARVEVSVEPQGILISLMDKDDIGMFASASALPDPKLVQLMAKVSTVVKKRSEKIVIRGHTDGLKFRQGTSDNWRLSMARAYSAYAILLEAGVDKSRFGRIEGHADRMLRDTRDIGSASNRRIEILLEREPT